MTTSRPSEPVTGERVAVTFRGGTEREGIVREPWNAPLFGPSFVVDFSPSEYVIAPAAAVRRLQESEA